MLTNYVAGRNLTNVMKIKILKEEYAGEVIRYVQFNLEDYGALAIAACTEIDGELLVPIDEQLNQKHCIYYKDEIGTTFKEVEYIKLFHPTKGSITIDLEDAEQHMIGVEIIRCEP